MGTREREIVDFAMAKEKASAQFYRRWAKKVTKSDVRELLLQLAEEEEEHYQRIASTPVDVLLSAPPARPDFRLSDDLDPVEPSEDLTLPEAFQMAIAREVASIEMYERLRRYGGSGEALFASLLEEERRHKHALEERYARSVRGID